MFTVRVNSVLGLSFLALLRVSIVASPVESTEGDHGFQTTLGITPP